MLCGIDEAGRGPVIGPMVIAKVCGKQETFQNLGARDSKLLSERRREAIFEKFKELGVHFQYFIVSEEEIDRAVSMNRLNLLEADYISKLVEKGHSYIVDCPDVNEARFKDLLIEKTGVTDIISEHKADFNYPVVSAASIVAKVIREEQVALIRKEIGNFGSGYPADPITRSFLLNYINEKGKLPPHTRKSWKTVRNMLTNLDRY